MKQDKETYRQLHLQADALITGESDRTANLANVAALLHDVTGYFWIGFYLVKGDEMVLGPFQGPVACTRIGFGKGVCGAAWRDKCSYDVPDVHAFPGHIACSSLSQSEFVTPILVCDQVVAFLDVDSERLSDFYKADLEGIEGLADIIAKHWTTWT